MSDKKSIHTHTEKTPVQMAQNEGLKGVVVQLVGKSGSLRTESGLKVDQVQRFGGRKMAGMSKEMLPSRTSNT